MARTKPRLARRADWYLCLLVGTLLACSDDDRPADAGTRPVERDAGQRARDATVEEDASEPDAAPPYDCSEGSFWFYGSNAVRIPLAQFCSPNRCPSSLQSFSQGFVCMPYEDYGPRSPWDYFDAGEDKLWVRDEGCGSIQFSGIGSMPTVVYDFDPITGDFLGGATFDDIAHSIAGTPCESEGVVAGKVRMPCSETVVTICLP